MTSKIKATRRTQVSALAACHFYARQAGFGRSYSDRRVIHKRKMEVRRPATRFMARRAAAAVVLIAPLAAGVRVISAALADASASNVYTATYTVQEGNSKWDICQLLLDTDDERVLNDCARSAVPRRRSVPCRHAGHSNTSFLRTPSSPPPTLAFSSPSISKASPSSFP